MDNHEFKTLGNYIYFKRWLVLHSVNWHIDSSSIFFHIFGNPIELPMLPLHGIHLSLAAGLSHATTLKKINVVE